MGAQAAFIYLPIRILRYLHSELSLGAQETAIVAETSHLMAEEGGFS